MPGDRIEHGAIIPDELVDDLARLRISVVTQPAFLADRGDTYLRDVEARDLPDLYRCASLRAAGIPLALSSDAPYGPADPWRALRVAGERRTGSGSVIGHHERLDPSAAVAAMLAPTDEPGRRPREIGAGRAADLIVLNGTVAESVRADDPVGTVLVRGVRID